MENDLKKYYDYRENIKPGDLISFSDHPSIISRLISLRTGSIHTHSAMVIDRIGPTGQRLLIIESLNSGPAPRYLSDRVKNYKGNVWHFPLKFVTGQQRENAVACVWDFVCRGVKYDYHSLFKQIIARVSINARELFCTEMVQVAWEQAEIMKHASKVFYPGELTVLPFMGTGNRLNL